MNISSLGWNPFKSLLNIIVDFFNLIPKTIYFLYACLASAVDAMQAFVRKLAGLDVYWIASGVAGSSETQAVAQRDPLTEFIYGILGYGQNAEVYRGLNTVFWSLAIFAVIMLAVSTMVAIIKSHYNEDTAGTSPVKYIYQAIKAVLTFAVIPFVVLIGMRINTFLLSTLDRIIAGSGNEEEVVAVYGSNAATKFVSETLQGSDVKCYIHYDYFGAGGPSTSSTFSGMLFKAAAYNANRARDGKGEMYKRISIGGVQIFGAADCSNYTNATDSNEYIATQIDYAFANNLNTDPRISYNNIMDKLGMDVFGGADIWRITGFGSFTKFNPSLVWQFYNLWQFNFIIGFAGVFATFTMMISIILGLMSRIIKGAALFLVYPALLGLAPIDNFKAFKSWGTEFMKQVLMAVGSILGINLLLLILPYVQTIKFFNVGVIDAIINIILLIVGLSMAKDFISMVSGFVGGADALSVGGGLKGEVSANLKKGIGTTAKIGLGAARVGIAAGAKIGKGIAKATSARRANKERAKAREAEIDINKANTHIRKAETNREKVFQSHYDQLSDGDKEVLRRAELEAKKQYRDEIAKSGGTYSEDEAKKRMKQARDAKMLTFEDNEDLKAAEQRITDAKQEKKNAEDRGLAHLEKEEKIAKKYGLKKNEDGSYRKMNSEEKGILKEQQRAAAHEKGEAYGLKETLFGYKDKDGNQKSLGVLGGLGKQIADGFDGSKLGKTMADVFLKNIANVGANMGLDKVVAGAADALKGTLTFKGGIYQGSAEEKKNLTGDKLARENAKEARESATAMQKKQDRTNELIEAQTKAIEKMTQAFMNSKKP